MSYWSHNPELYTEITFKEMVRQGFAKEEDYENIEEVVDKFIKEPDSWRLIVDAESSYWADRIDEAKERRTNF